MKSSTFPTGILEQFRSRLQNMTIKEKQKTTKRLHSSVLLVVLLVFLIFIVLQMAAEFCQNFSWKCL
jgi:hypothetical protein